MAAGGEIGDQLTTLVAVGATALLGFRAFRMLQANRFAIAPADLHRRMTSGEDLLVLDVRTADEFNGKLGHVNGAVNLPIGELPARLNTLKEQFAALRDTTVVITCLHGPRASNGLAHMRRAGFRNLHVLKGGMAAWSAAGLPVHRK